MSSGGLANLEAFEGTVTEETTIALKRYSRKLVITNDHGTQVMTYKFNTSETAATLKGTETLSMGFRTKTIIINGSSVPYRIWSFG